MITFSASFFFSLFRKINAKIAQYCLIAFCFFSSHAGYSVAPQNADNEMSFIENWKRIISEKMEFIANKFNTSQEENSASNDDTASNKDSTQLPQQLIEQKPTLNTNETRISKLEKCPSFLYNPAPIADWLISIKVMDFFYPYLKQIFLDKKRYNEICSLHRWQIFLQPSFFSSSFSFHKKKLNLESISVLGGISYSIKTNWLFGLGIGYNSSKQTWQEYYPQIDTHCLLIAPYIGFATITSFISFSTLFGYQWSQLKRTIEWNDQKTDLKHSNDSFFVAPQLQGGFDIYLGKKKSSNLIIQPNSQIHYLHIFYYPFREKVNKKTIFSIKSRHMDFFRFKLASNLRKEFLSSSGFFVPEISVGWVYMHPLSTAPGPLRVHFKKPEKQSEIFYPSSLKSSHLISLGINFSYIFKCGILLRGKYAGEFGKRYPSQFTSIRFEWDF